MDLLSFFGTIGLDHPRDYLADTDVLNKLQPPVEITEVMGEHLCRWLKRVPAYLSMAPGPLHAKQNALKNAGEYKITEWIMKHTTCTSLVGCRRWSGQPQEASGVACKDSEEKAKTNK